jgi:hypothetical protein
MVDWWDQNPSVRGSDLPTCEPARIIQPAACHFITCGHEVWKHSAETNKRERKNLQRQKQLRYSKEDRMSRKPQNFGNKSIIFMFCCLTDGTIFEIKWLIK